MFLGGTFLIAVFRLIRKNATPEAKRRRSVNKNQVLTGLALPCGCCLWWFDCGCCLYKSPDCT